MRSEGDTWDVVSRVGRTALFVAASRAAESKQADALIQDEFAALFVEGSGDPDTIRLINDPELWAQSSLSTGFIGLRSKFFDDHFLAAAGNGVRQAVILAAGLDARAYRLDWPLGMVVFEIDQLKVLEFKREVLTDVDATPKADRQDVVVDLREDWPSALIDAGFDPDVPTVWSAEGLLMYLPGAAQDALFARIDELSAPGSRMASDAVEIGDDFRMLAEQQAQQLRDTQVDLTELFYTDDRLDPAEWLTAQGWRAAIASSDELAERYGRPLTAGRDALGQLVNKIKYLSAVKQS
ncbi:class I SAM-dependent methyltransferase [Nocardia sp. NPDC006044]|uniref:class I SAM-dependent methyltransferase n=1 Tax=Nocardia sp. NPDC006044 TaxID=3364306 RepID=UPI00369D1E0D